MEAKRRRTNPFMALLDPASLLQYIEDVNNVSTANKPKNKKKKKRKRVAAAPGIENCPITMRRQEKQERLDDIAEAKMEEKRLQRRQKKIEKWQKILETLVGFVNEAIDEGLPDATEDQRAELEHLRGTCVAYLNERKSEVSSSMSATELKKIRISVEMNEKKAAAKTFIEEQLSSYSGSDLKLPTKKKRKTNRQPLGDLPVNRQVRAPQRTPIPVESRPNQAENADPAMAVRQLLAQPQIQQQIEQQVQQQIQQRQFQQWMQQIQQMQQMQQNVQQHIQQQQVEPQGIQQIQQLLQLQQLQQQAQQHQIQQQAQQVQQQAQQQQIEQQIPEHIQANEYDILYCYCNDEQNQDLDTMVECSNGKECNGWVHRTCEGDEIPEDENFQCAACLGYLG